ncbi:MAG: glycosyltransferase [Paludibacter sp.]|jgi:glycosyltransferase involved in cell wall biosynthesis|nr:glycosyltransferase [Paludibacter sp.]
MSKALISIIIPVYNAENYLNQCIESIINQCYNNFELIIIDDGSTDKSGHICDEFAEKDNRINVIHKQNGGVSSARNAGIDAANGDWICFVDSDDLLENTFLQNIINNIAENVQLVATGYREQNRKGNWNVYLPEKQVFSNKQILLFYEQYLTSCICRAPWGKLFLKSVIDENAIRFDQSIGFGEDSLFCLQYFKKINSILVLDFAEYNWRFVENSLSRHNAVNKIDTLCLSFDKFIDEIAPELTRFSDSEKLKKNVAIKYLTNFLQKTEFLYISSATASQRREMLKNFVGQLRKYPFNYSEITADYGIPAKVAAAMYKKNTTFVFDIVLNLYFKLKKIL